MTPIQETRARSRIYAPPRSAVPVPEEGSIFGRGLLRRLRESGAGCMLLLFLAVGLAIFSFGALGTWGPSAESLQAGNDPRSFLGFMAFGAVFFLVALRMLQILLTETKGEEIRKRRGVNQKQPWTGDYPWRPEGMPPDYSTTTGGSFLGRVAILSFFGLFNMVFLSDSPWIVRGIVLFFDLFGALILLDSLHKIWQALRHPRPAMRWTTFPAFLGGRLEGVFAVRSSLRIQGPVRATLRCVKDRQAGEAQEPFSIYEQVCEFPTAGDRLKELPLAFDLPMDLPGTDLGRSEAVYWQVVLQIPVAGPDFETVFLAPVYAATEAPPSWTAG